MTMTPSPPLGWPHCDFATLRRVGMALGRVAPLGLVVGLQGTLGAGKTALVRAVAEGLDTPDARLVTSPTFLLIQEYQGRLPLYHFDTYRLKSEEEFLDLGVEEYFFGDGVCVVEWSDRVAALLPRDRLEVTLTITGETTRTIEAVSWGKRWGGVLATWQEAYAVLAARQKPDVF